MQLYNAPWNGRVEGASNRFALLNEPFTNGYNHPYLHSLLTGCNFSTSSVI